MLLLLNPTSSMVGKVISRGNELLIVNASVIQILIAHNTNYYNPQLSPIAHGVEQIVKAAGITSAILERDHRAAFSSQMGRVSMHIGKGNAKAEDLPIDKRLEAYHKDPQSDPKSSIALHAVWSLSPAL